MTHKMKVFSPDGWDGLRNSLVFGAAFVPIYLAIGMAGQQLARSFAETLSMTLFIFSTPLQFILIESRESFWVLAPIILIMNARFLLFAASLAPYLGKTALHKLIPSIILLTPSVFSVCVARFRRPIERPFHYFLGLGLPILVISIVCTIAGFFLAQNFSSPFWSEVMRLALPLQFTMLAAKQWGEHFAVSSYGLGFMMAPLLLGIIGDLGPLLTPILIGFVVMMAEDGFNARNRHIKCGQ